MCVCCVCVCADFYFFLNETDGKGFEAVAGDWSSPPEEGRRAGEERREIGAVG